MLTNLNNIVRYTVSGATYAITYPYWTTEEIKAYITLPDGTVSELTYGTDFTVTAPNGVNGTLTKVSAWTDAEKLTIVREVELTQEIDLINGEKIDGEQLEAGLDLKTAGLQQLNEKFTRSVMTSIDETGDNMVIPNSTARKGTGDGTLLGFDGTGGNIVLRDLKQFDADVANTAANASASSASATLAQKWAENPEDTQVVTGSYSALHHANKAKASATSASNSATTSQQKAEDSESWAVGKRSGSDVPATDPAYHNNSKYYLDLVKQTISGALRYQGTWTTTSQTDYTSISLPRLKGDMYYCQGTATTIDGVTYTQGDYIIFNVDVPSGTITTSMLDKIDNTETVTPDNLATLTNKTIDALDNTIKISPTAISTTPSPRTISLDGKIKNISLRGDGTTIEIPNPPYVGYKLTITQAANYGYVIFKSPSGTKVCTFIYSGTLSLTAINDTRWAVDSGSSFAITDPIVITNAPLKDDGVTQYSPNDWKEFYGVGTYHFIYEGISTYELPVNNASVAVTWESVSRATAQAQRWDDTTTGSPLWTRKMATTWATFWTRFDGTADYSTSEVKTGEYWIDGKPIYSKVYKTTLPTTTTDGAFVTTGTEYNDPVENIIAVNSNLEKTNSTYSASLPRIWQDTPSPSSPLIILCAGAYTSTNGITIWAGNSRPGHSGYNVSVTVFYTKTTD